MDSNVYNNSTSHNTSSDQNKNEALKQFYYIITFIFILLLVFLGFFIYNLIKCYLPKWRNKKELVKEEGGRSLENRKIEFEDI